MKNLFKKVYEIVKTVPAGKVVTYGQIAKLLGTSDSRKIGFALHANKSDSVPCHRVVNREGGLALNFAFNGLDEQRRRLLDEGVLFKDETHVDLSKSQYYFPGESV